MSSPASLFHLGLLDKQLPTPDKHVNDYRVDKFKQSTENITKYRFDIPRIADQYELHGIIITFAEDAKEITSEKEGNHIKNATLTLTVAGHVASRTMLGFLAKSQTAVKWENANCILLSDNARYPLDICSLPHNVFSYELEIDFPGITDISAIGNYCFLNIEKRKQLTDGSPHNQIIPINNAHVIDLNKDIPISESVVCKSNCVSQVLKTRLEFNGVTRGYFISGDIDNLENVTLLFNGHERWNYDKLMLRILGTRVSDKMLYLSFDGLHYAAKSDGYNSGLNCSFIDNQTIKLTFSTFQKSAIVFNHGYATLEYKKNICNVLTGQ